MKKFKVSLRGENFQIEVEGTREVKTLGFFTTRIIEAKTKDNAEMEAVDAIRHLPRLQTSVRNDREDPPRIYAESVIEVVDAATAEGELALVFFPDESTDAPN